MSSSDLYLAVFLSNKSSPRMKAWNELSEPDRNAKQQAGVAAWKEWIKKHQTEVVGTGGPLGKTKRVSHQGIEDVSNDLSAFIVIRAESHDAAAKLFEQHPHFTIFPGDSVEIMPVLPIPSP